MKRSVFRRPLGAEVIVFTAAEREEVALVERLTEAGEGERRRVGLRRRSASISFFPEEGRGATRSCVENGAQLRSTYPTLHIFRDQS